MSLANFLAFFLITHLSSLCHCFSIISSYCISPSPVVRSLGLANTVHLKAKPAFRDLRLSCNGFWLSVFTGMPPSVSTPANVHSLLNANCAALSIRTIYAFGKRFCIGCYLLHPSSPLIALLYLVVGFFFNPALASTAPSRRTGSKCHFSALLSINDFCGYRAFMVKEFS